MRVTRWFFLGSIAAVFLTVSILIFSPNTSTTPIEALTDEVVSGFGVWREYGCESCHTLYGQGGAYAPDLTHIYSQRGENYLREFLVNPSAFHPDQRLMPRFGLTRTETDDLLAFLEAVGQSENAAAPAAAFPPRTIRVSGGDIPSLGEVISAQNFAELEVPTDPVANGRYWFSRPPANCATCHSLESDVVIVGPSLDGIAARAANRAAAQSAEQYLRDSLINPGAYVVEGYNNVMAQNLGDMLNSDQINNIIAFLLTLD